MRKSRRVGMLIDRIMRKFNNKVRVLFKLWEVRVIYFAYCLLRGAYGRRYKEIVYCDSFLN